MSEDNSIFRGFLRGNPRRQDASAPEPKFQDEQRVLQSEALSFSEDNKEGKIFLGLAGAEVVIDNKMPRLPDGRTNRYAIGGKAIGVGDDRRLVSIAGNRSGKSRSVLLPNLLCYPGSMLVIDPKGDLARYTARWRQEKLSQTVYVLDPFEAGGAALRPFAANFNRWPCWKEAPIFGRRRSNCGCPDHPNPTGSKDPHWDNRRVFSLCSSDRNWWKSPASSPPNKASVLPPLYSS